ncbi:hypothetical protein, partial [Paraburkholderia sp. Ac-20336]|uniref:hypothetical protein n=1 Tax=Paraburkholderia sp. Ac-20336 TaxID=2703886 RepID=UPI00197E6ABE
ASSAHTYRLLVFKDQSAHSTMPNTTRHRFVCVAASAAEKRDYADRPASRQDPCANFLAKGFIPQPYHAAKTNIRN